MTHYLLYTRKTQVSGRALADALGIPAGVDSPDYRVDYLIRYGSQRSVRYVPRVQTINKQRALRIASDKLSTLVRLQQAGIHVPRFSTDPLDLNLPLLARTTDGMQGRDVNLIVQIADLEHMSADFYTEYIPKQKEYRIHVIDGRMVKVSQKVRLPDNTEKYDPLVWNYSTGWTFRYPPDAHPGTTLALAAVGAVGLDFGAVDLIIGEDDCPYVLEINTGPGLDTTLPLYAKHLARMVDLDYVELEGATA